MNFNDWEMKRTLLIFLSLLVAAASVAAQTKYSLQGKVFDSKTGTELAGAAITLKETNTVWAESNSSGTFTLRITAGEYTLVVSLIGYQTLEQQNHLMRLW